MNFGYGENTSSRAHITALPTISSSLVQPVSIFVEYCFASARWSQHKIIVQIHCSPPVIIGGYSCCFFPSGFTSSFRSLVSALRFPEAALLYRYTTLLLFMFCLCIVRGRRVGSIAFNSVENYLPCFEYFVQRMTLKEHIPFVKQVFSIVTN
jgi:hypothetical protein